MAERDLATSRTNCRVNFQAAQRMSVTDGGATMRLRLEDSLVSFAVVYFAVQFG